jgi:hypothetical protein
MTAGTLTTAPTPWTALHSALQARRPLLVEYHGRRRLICPHAIGWKQGRPMLLGYQTGEQTTTKTPHPDPTPRWRCFYIDQIDHTAPAQPANPWVTPHTYNPTQPFPAGVIDQLHTAITPPPAPTPE